MEKMEADISARDVIHNDGKGPFFGLEQIVSGGQTGADRAGLDVAISLGIPHGGWCPAGRRAEDGEIPSCYRLRETLSPSYLIRTEWNVRDSDATLIFTASGLRGGSWRTAQFAEAHGKSYLHIELSLLPRMAAWKQVTGFLSARPWIRRLNIAGSRESSEPGIHSMVKEVLLAGLRIPAGGFPESGL